MSGAGSEGPDPCVRPFKLGHDVCKDPEVTGSTMFPGSAGSPGGRMTLGRAAMGKKRCRDNTELCDVPWALGAASRGERTSLGDPGWEQRGRRA